MQRPFRPLLELRGELVLVVLQALAQPLAVPGVDDRVVQHHPGLLDLRDLRHVTSLGTRELPDPAGLGEHSDSREHEAQHVRRSRVDRLLVVLTVPRQDDVVDPVEPVLLPQHVHVLGQGPTVAFPAVVEEQPTVEPLEGDPRGGVRLLAGGSDVERHVHRMSRVQVELGDPIVLDHLHVRFTVDGSGVHLLEGAVVLLLEHAVVAEPPAIGFPVLLQLFPRAHGWKAMTPHHLVQVVDRAHDDLEILAPLEALHQLPQRVAPLPTWGGRNHESLLLTLVREDREQTRDRVLPAEQAELGEGILLEGCADTVLVLSGLEVALELHPRSVREVAFHAGVVPLAQVGRHVVLQHSDVLA